MSETDDTPTDGPAVADLDPETRELVASVEANADDLRELVELVVVAKRLGDDLAPEAREAATDIREPLADLRLALEREETRDLLEAVGHNADDLAELLEFAAASKNLAEDLAPELQAAASEARHPMAQLRLALEREETLVLLRKLGENTETFIELLDLLEASHGLLEDLVPELRTAASDARSPIADFRMVLAGFADAHETSDVDPYEMGQGLGHALALGATVGDPEVVDAVDAGLGAFREDEEPEPVGLFRLLGALREDDVRAGLGQLVDVIRRMGANARE
ncbi:DUF1641 domain-containing protein [Salinibaculum rarum]|uniref:DUF1641 domain-containing protein n=1 Tax=Salinibaculum rarum TaxID=3058903 RepID=UPI00265E5E84|nr:DUF1641 domain-containing protein [Salinibaculum sp. KK48]